MKMMKRFLRYGILLTGMSAGTASFAQSSVDLYERVDVYVATQMSIGGKFWRLG
jgi:hypothetical protein